MSQLNPQKLHVRYFGGIKTTAPITPRAYTLTHSDSTGDLYLSIGNEYDLQQISGWYTRLMRDEVLAEWKDGREISLHVHCHVSGGFVVGTAGWRYAIFRQHLPMVLQAFRYGDRALIDTYPHLGKSVVYVHFNSSDNRFNKVEAWGSLDDYRI